MSLKFLFVALLFVCLYYVCEARSTYFEEPEECVSLGKKRDEALSEWTANSSEGQIKYGDDQTHQFRRQFKPSSHFERAKLRSSSWRRNNKPEDANRIYKISD